MCGSTMKKLISGGERKRTAIGVELITDPQCIILDEPTSGLDSFTAVRIVKFLEKLANTKKKTIVSTIHQPSHQAFSHCDHLILLADGHVVYQGPGCESGEYFDKHSRGDIKRSSIQSSSDFFMRVLSINYPKQAADNAKIAYYLEKYQELLAKKVLNKIEQTKYPKLKNIGEENF